MEEINEGVLDIVKKLSKNNNNATKNDLQNEKKEATLSYAIINSQSLISPNFTICNTCFFFVCFFMEKMIQMICWRIFTPFRELHAPQGHH